MTVTPCNNCASTDWKPCFEENGHTLGQCQSCDLLYIQPMPTADTRMTEMENGHFAGGAKKVLVATKQTAAEAARHRIFENYLDTVRGHVTTGNWLEIGCGAGHLMSLAKQAGYNVEGVELTADRRAASIAAGFRVHGQPVEELALPAESFDVISLINVFSHLTDPAGTFAELRRILRPGGVILVATGELNAPPRKGDVFFWNLGDHLFFLGKRTIESMAEAAGLRVASHDLTWLPADVYTGERLSVKGRSGVRNAAKAAIVKTPGALPLLRSFMLRRQADNPVYSAVVVLTPLEVTTTA